MAGGKLTGYRTMAERVVNLLSKKMEEEEGIELEECTTVQIPLCGNDFRKSKHVKKYISEIFERIVADGFTEYDAWYLVTTYGKQTEAILEDYSILKDEDPYIRMAKAELHYGIKYEMITSPMDFFIRRTGRLYFDIESIPFLLDPILDEFKSIFKLDDSQILSWKEKMLQEIHEHSTFSLDRV
jgi:glycerol-3-phosphate dehydrogenase